MSVKKRLVGVVVLTVCAVSVPSVGFAQTGNDLFAEVGRHVPQFAGLAADPTEDAALIVFVTERYNNVVADVKAAVGAVFGPSFIETYPFDNVRLVDVAHSFVQLKEWRDRLVSTVYRIDGVVSSTIDLQTNSIVIGVENLEEQGPLVEEEVERHGIPKQAVLIKTGHTVETTSLPLRSIERGWWLGASVAGLSIAGAVGAFLVRRKRATLPPFPG